MAEIIIDYLEQSADKYPKKVAYADEYESVTYEELRKRTYKIAYQLIKRGYEKEPIAIYLKKSVRCIVMMLGVLYSGNYYTVLDIDMPSERIKKIISVFSPAIVIADKKHKKQCKEILEQYNILAYDNLLADEYDIEFLKEKGKNILPSDLSQVIFTSGSTGIPKGVMLSHGGVVSGTESRSKRLGYNESDIFANQFPFHFVGCLNDIFCTLKNGATDYILPKELFFSPKRLVEFLGERKITVLDWIAPALSLIAKYGALSDVILQYVRIVVFGGEPMPIKYLRLWKKALPNAAFFNVYASSELTNGILFYKVEREFENNGQLPLGFPIEEAEVFLLDEENKNVEQEGELCIRSNQLAAGYYKNIEETSNKFIYIYNKTGKKIKIYKTGDLVKYNERGELIFVGRKDFQIKRHGYRIELGEIECTVNTLNEIRDVACIYDKDKEKIVLFYCGHIAATKLKRMIEKKMPHYMIPDICIKLDEIPRNINGKIDRIKLTTLYERGYDNE